jgi:hypothetical protein
MNLNRHLLFVHNPIEETNAPGCSLAYAELYLTLPAVICRLVRRLELFETTVEDVRYDHECFVPVPREGSRGVRVLVK